MKLFCKYNNLINIEWKKMCRKFQIFLNFSEKRSGTLCLIFELMDMNIYEMIRSIFFPIFKKRARNYDSLKGQRTYISPDKICKYMYQLLQAVDHMHR